MHKLMRFVTATSFAALIGAATPVWAESAPVFDVDSFDSSGADQSQDLPMPPAPGEETAAATHAVPASVGAPAPATTFVPATPAPAASTVTVGAAATEEPAPAGSAGASVSTANLSPEERMRRLEQQLSNLQHSEGVQQVESLQSEVQSLRGQIEVLNHELDKVRSQQTTASKDPVGKSAAADSAVMDDDTTGKPVASAGAIAVETPVAQTASKKAAAKKPAVATVDKAAPAAAAVSKDQPNVAEEQKIYQTAYDFIKAKKYNDAVNALQDMLKKYPSGQFASNAHYWLGELYGLMGKNDNAFDEFSIVISKFPGSPRVSDAQLKVGLILAAQSKWPDAKRAFKQVINTYPGTASARLASEQLKQIKTAGH